MKMRKIRKDCERKKGWSDNMIMNVCHNKESCDECDNQYNLWEIIYNGRYTD